MLLLALAAYGQPPAPTGAGPEPGVIQYSVPGVQVSDGMGGTVSMDYFAVDADGVFMGVVYDWQVLTPNRYGDQLWSTLQTFTAQASGIVQGNLLVNPGSTAVFRATPHVAPSGTFKLKWDAPIITAMVGSQDDPFTFVPIQLQTSGQTWAVYMKTDLSVPGWTLLGTTMDTSWIVDATRQQAYFTVLSTNIIPAPYNP